MFKYGKMVLNTKVIGVLIKLAARVSSGTLTAMSSKVNGSTIRPTDMAYMSIKMERDTKENGRMISNTAKERRSGPIIPCMKATIMRAKSMERVYISGRMVQAMKATGLRIG